MVSKSRKSTLRVFAIGLALAVAAGPARAAVTQGKVTVVSSYVEADMSLQGGGGATPYSVVKNKDRTAYLGNVSVSVSGDTGHRIAEDGAGQSRGTGRGTGLATATASTSGQTLSGSGTVAAHFEATPDLGAGQSIDTASFQIDFEVTEAPVPYTMIANLTDDHGSPDQVQLRRMDSGPSGVPVVLCSSFNPNVQTSGTLQEGVYRIFGSVNAFESGGHVQGSGDETVSYDYSLTFGAGTELAFVFPEKPPVQALAPGMPHPALSITLLVIGTRALPWLGLAR